MPQVRDRDDESPSNISSFQTQHLPPTFPLSAPACRFSISVILGVVFGTPSRRSGRRLGAPKLSEPAGNCYPTSGDAWQSARNLSSDTPPPPPWQTRTSTFQVFGIAHIRHRKIRMHPLV